MQILAYHASLFDAKRQAFNKTNRERLAANEKSSERNNKWIRK